MNNSDIILAQEKALLYKRLFAIIIMVGCTIGLFLLANTVTEASIVTVRPAFIGIAQSGGYGTPHTIAVLDSDGNVWITQENNFGDGWSNWHRLPPIPYPLQGVK